MSCNDDTTNSRFSPARRSHLAALGSLAVAACGGTEQSVAPPPPSPPPPPPPPPGPPPPPPSGVSIKQAAAAKGRRFGSTFAWGLPNSDTGSFANPNYAALLERDCAILVPENELKWQELRPSATSYDFTKFDAMLAYAESKNMAMRGHTLLWYEAQRFPNWLTNYAFGAQPRAEAEQLLQQHIQAVTRRYGNRIVSYDVINEAIQPETGALRRNSLSNAVGNDTSLLDLAFRTARAELPNTELVYNDYMDWGEGQNIAHRRGVLELLRGFKMRGVPVDALGIQAHIGFYSSQPTAQLIAQRTGEWRRFLDEVVGMGYKLVITELDVNDSSLPVDIASRDREVAAYVRGYMDLMLSYRQLKDVLVWGMCDKYSWLQSFNPRTDGAQKRCCPYDANFAAKPFRNALIESFQAAAAI